MVAHRGLSAEEPENTLRSFRRAAEAGADAIEFDVHLSRDDEAVVIHDDTVDRTTGGHGFVRDLSLRELRALDAGRGERIPTFDEVCAWARGAGDFALAVELKQPEPVGGRPAYPDLAERVVAILRDHRLERRVVVISFDHPTLRRVRDLDAELPTGTLYGSGTFADPLTLGRAVDASGIHPWWSAVSPAICETAHDAGMHVHGWGLGGPDLERRLGLLVRAGVDSVDANDPRPLRRLLDGLA